ncbi:MAG TPA: hypothetical protein DCE73_04870 [Paraprevotella xylaniphila]|nr:hypothetical protein [Paraprevotella xylaniphila]
MIFQSAANDFPFAADFFQRLKRLKNNVMTSLHFLYKHPFPDGCLYHTLPEESVSLPCFRCQKVSFNVAMP